MRLKKFVAALFDEGAVKKITPCRDEGLCVVITHLFRDFEFSDKRAVAALLKKYADLEPVGTVAAVRFMDAEAGIEWGR